MNEPHAAPTDPRSHPSPGAPAQPQRVQIVVWDGVELLDLAGPGQVFAVAGFQVEIVAARPGTVVSQGFLRLEPTGVLGQGPDPDLLVVPGGNTHLAVADAELVDGVRAVGARVPVLLSVCTGALILAAAGLLDEVAGGQVTTWHGALDRLRAAAPGVEVVEGVRWVDHGRVVTSAGVSAGIDASLHLVSRLLGPDARASVAAYMEYEAAS